MIKIECQKGSCIVNLIETKKFSDPPSHNSLIKLIGLIFYSFLDQKTQHWQQVSNSEKWESAKLINYVQKATTKWNELDKVWMENDKWKSSEEKSRSLVCTNKHHPTQNHNP